MPMQLRRPPLLCLQLRSTGLSGSQGLIIARYAE